MLVQIHKLKTAPKHVYIYMTFQRGRGNVAVYGRPGIHGIRYNRIPDTGAPFTTFLHRIPVA
jgi:hypothetical protein